jgi:hypothetical protein
MNKTPLYKCMNCEHFIDWYNNSIWSKEDFDCMLRLNLETNAVEIEIIDHQKYIKNCPLEGEK